MNQKEHLDAKSNQPPKANAQKNLHRKSSCQNSSSDVLRQNNLKQNHSMDTNDKLIPSRPLVSNSQGRKAIAGDSSYGRHRSSNGIHLLKLLNDTSGLDKTAKLELYSHLEALAEVLLEAYSGAVTAKIEREEEHKGLLNEY
ncbi:hypothetical protein KIW84_022696 [Lathyrus oleraceus]|uniref:Uncharacterized protein n=1 Tax=Pisum sativum TaxID=3888 RepID=A0A9D4YB50_PEA|nr:hypothetical protein KIW84_022696 [Pisum sativum]